MVNLNECTTNDLEQTSTQDERKQVVERNNAALVHVSNCKEPKCDQPMCDKFKNDIHHMKHCQRNSNGKCTICSGFLSLCAYHAKRCNEDKCPTYLCSIIKYGHQSHQLLQSRKQNETISRRVSFMINEESESNSSEDEDLASEASR